MQRIAWGAYYSVLPGLCVQLNTGNLGRDRSQCSFVYCLHVISFGARWVIIRVPCWVQYASISSIGSMVYLLRSTLRRNWLYPFCFLQFGRSVYRFYPAPCSAPLTVLSLVSCWVLYASISSIGSMFKLAASLVVALGSWNRPSGMLHLTLERHAAVSCARHSGV